jgi:DNA-binding SARP family transcriptional activator
MNGYPIQLAKVQRPALRDQTLARDRLLDWLAAKVHQRVVLVLADAGYGKTTLLADFSRRTRLRTIWYRLDDDDRDWISFISHLIAAGREHDPGFAPTSAAMLGDLSMGGPTREAATDVFLRELPAIAARGAVLILDDFHVVDESPDVRLIARELVARAPERLSIIFASRRVPSIPLARMRAAGEVAELGTDELRFDTTETARLFSETYGRELEPDVLADVAARTEGWAASLQLVQAALRDRSPADIRRFVRGLTGADQELYDYLAEEVVGDLPEDLQQFLMRTSILQIVSADLAAVVTGLDAAEVGRLSAAAERLTLLTRPSRTARLAQRYHPLVREFLEARLRSTISAEAVAQLHRSVAAEAAEFDWRVAAYHYRQAGDPDAVAATIAAAIPEIMGGGQHQIAIEEIDRIPEGSRLPGLSLVASRMDMQHRQYDPVIRQSNAILETVEPGSQESDYALLNLMTMYFQSGFSRESLAPARRLRETTSNEHLSMIADGINLLVGAEQEGDLVLLGRHLESMADRQRGIHPHFYGVTRLNLANTYIAGDAPSRALACADEAILALAQTSSRLELSAAMAAKGYSLTMLGRIEDGQAALESSALIEPRESTYERVDIADSFVSPETAGLFLDVIHDYRDSDALARVLEPIQAAWFHGRRGRVNEARACFAQLELSVQTSYVGQKTIEALTNAYIAAVTNSEFARRVAIDAGRRARKQGILRWARVAELLADANGPPEEFGATIRRIAASSPWNVTYVADLICRRVDDLDEETIQVLAPVTGVHPGRWRFELRRVIDTAELGCGLAAARLLEGIGDRSDIVRLRGFAKRQRKLRGASNLGRQLSRRLADPVFVEDQGRVAIRIGEREVSGSSFRRKVLALLCFLLTRRDMSSTRDQVLEGLWPELDPADALNSLNQTVYFLRRVIEEVYVDDLSPGYVHHESDLIWLDGELVASRSNRCRTLMKSFPTVPSPDQVADLVASYRAPFALDFEYEEWAAPYREWLHASYLEIVERAVTNDLETGHFERGIHLARRVLDVDPAAEQVELSLLKLYRASGAHAAAAEQYTHYASTMREQLGLEPPPLESL